MLLTLLQITVCWLNAKRSRVYFCHFAEKPICASNSFVFHCFFTSYFFHKTTRVEPYTVVKNVSFNMYFQYL